MAQAPRTPLARFTRLYATINQEDDAFTVTVRLQHHLKRSEGIWGEEFTHSVEEASSMIAGLARQYSIPQKGIAIKIRMASFKDGTLH